MEEKNKGGIVVLLLGSALAVGTILLLTGKAKAEEGAEGAAEVVITIEEEAIAGAISVDPNALVEGSTYTVTATVTNKSTSLGDYVPATLRTVIWSALAGVKLAPDVNRADTYPANSALEITQTITIPKGTVGKGLIQVVVKDPDGNVLQQGSLAITAVAAEIDYGASVVVGV